MIGLYNHRWVSACGELPVNDDGSLTLTGSLWAEGLSGFTPDQIHGALRACMNRADDWPPVLSEFRAMCLDIPTIDFVRADIGKRTHGFSRLVWQHIDHYAFTRSDQRDADRLLRSAYDFARERRMCGDDYPPLLPAIAHEKPVPYTAPSEAHRAGVLETARKAALA